MPYQWKCYFDEHELRWRDWFRSVDERQKYRNHLRTTIKLYRENRQHFHDKAKENLSFGKAKVNLLKKMV